MELPAWGVQKPPLQGRRKTVPGRILSCSCCDDEETNGSENETRLEVAGPPGHVAAGVAVAPGPGGLLRRLGLPGVASTDVHALRQLTVMISSRCPIWRVKVRGPWQRMA